MTISAKRALADAGKIITAWTPDPLFKFGKAPDDEHTLVSFTAERDKLQKMDDDIDETEMKLRGARDRRKDQAAALHALVLRARNGMKSYYGADSLQYDQAGGIRESDRASGLHRKSAATRLPSAETVPSSPIVEA